MVVTALILRYEWDDGVEWDSVTFPLCASYGPPERAHETLHRLLAANDYLEIRDATGNLWPLHSETLYASLIWAQTTVVTEHP